MKPKAQNPHEDGLLEYLEDIIGSNKYVKDIEEKSTLVEELTQNRNEKLNRVKVVEKEKDSLEEAKGEAEEYMKKEREFLSKKVVEYSINEYEAKKGLDDVTEKINTLGTRMREFKERELSNKDKVDSLEKDYTKAQRAHDKLVSRQKDTKKRFSSFEAKDIQYRENLQHIQKSCKKLEASIKTESNKEKKQNDLAIKKTNDLAELDAAVAAAEKSKEKAEGVLEKFYASLKDKTEPLRTKLEKKQESLAPLTKAKIEKQSHVEVVQTEIQILEKAVNTAKESYSEAEKELAQIREAIVNDPQERMRLESDLSSVNTKVQSLKARCKKLAAEEESSKEFLSQMRPKLESSRSLQAATAGRSAMLRELDEAKAGSLSDSGLYGRLGDLGEIDSKYDVAVSTACPGLDYLVTETTKGAEKCVKFLRERQLGRATFAILEKFNCFEEQMKEKQTPAPRLYDLIKVRDPKFRRAFYFAMRDTLVTETLDQAVKIAYSGNKCVWRVVTLDGTVIDKAGTMSGGGKRTKRGGMRLSNGKETAVGHECAVGGAESILSKEEVIKLEERISEQTKKLADVRKLLKEVKLDLNNAEKEKDSLEMSLEKHNIKSASLAQEKEHFESKLASLKPKCALSAKDKKALAQLTKELEKHQKSLKVAEENAKSLEDECAALQQEIMNVGGEKMVKLKGNVETAAAEADAAAKSLRKTKLAIKAHEKKAQVCSKNIEDAEKELVELQTKEDDLKSSFKAVEEEAFTVMQELNEIESTMKSSKQNLGLLKAEFTSLKSSFSKSEQQLVEMQNQMDVYTDEHKVCKERVVTWKKKREDVEQKFTAFLELCPTQNNTTNEDSIQFAKLPKVTAEDIDSGKYDKQEIIEQAAELKKDVDALKKDVNMGAIAEYRKRETEYAERVKELDEATKLRDDARDECDELRKKRLDEFMAGFSVITLKLKEMYQMITMGGDAELELVDSLDPFSEGIVFSVRPPKKSWKNISNLSGGEKTLSSLALVFALHHYNPTPLYVMDEIDAALDFKNVSIVANYIKERTKNAQFIIISLRNNMFELADRLVGIYKTHNATKSITINPGKIVERQMELRGEQPMQDRTNISAT